MAKIEKRCAKCGESKLLIEFGLSASTPDGRFSWCKSCQRQYVQYRRRRNRGKAEAQNPLIERLQLDRHQEKLEARRKSRRQYMYGISPEQYDRMLEEQNYLCALCGCELTPDTVPSIDHCHKINEMRGIVCRKCNLMIGLAEDNPKILYLGMKYLNQYQ